MTFYEKEVLMQIIQISDAEVRKLFEGAEGHFLDFKSIDIAPGKLTRSVSAFANSDGGEVFVGIEEATRTGEKSWRGFQSVEAANAHIQLVTSILPLGNGCRFTFLSEEGHHGLILQLEITKSKDMIKASTGEFYIRRGAQNLPVSTPEALERLKLNKGLISFESMTVAAPIDAITNSEPTIRFILEIVPHQEPEAWLRKQNLIIDNLPTTAGIVLFADEPQAYLPKRCGIKIYRYRSTDDEGTREALDGIPMTVEGCAYDQIYSAVAATKKIIEGISRMTPAGLVAVEYPQETLHEIITNAVLHRDYSLPDDIHIRVYDNRVEVESPGSLPGHITPANILDERFSRNGNIVRIINKFPNPPNKDVGEGMNTAFRAMKRLQLKEPEIRQRDSSVLVLIKHEQLASPEERIMTYLDSHNSISNGEARELCVIREDWRIRSIFGGLVDAGMIEKIPGSKTSNTAYQKIK
ncbi:MAG: ATP-binding protein [Telluria sp.]